MKMSWIRGLPLLLVLTTASCSSITSPRGCSTDYVYAVNVQVKDSVSNAMSASGAQMIARDGIYVDSVSAAANRPEVDALPLHAAGEREGTYTVTVRKSGFRDWTRANVQVTKGECHVNAVNLTALLQRL